MKKIIILAALVAATVSVKAQYVIDANNNIGIGTTTPVFDIDILRNSAADIEVKSTLNTSTAVVYVDNDNGKGVRMRTFGSAASGTLFNGAINMASSYGLFSNTGGGNFCIGGTTTNDNVYIGGGTTGITMRVDNATNKVGIGTGTTALSHNSLLWVDGEIRTGDPGAGAGDIQLGTILTGSDSEEYWEVTIDGNVRYIHLLTDLP